MASRPLATARWVFPASGGPGAGPPHHCDEAPRRDLPDLGLVERKLGAVVESGEDMGKRANPKDISIRRWSRQETLRAQNNVGASRIVSSRPPASSIRLANWSCSAVSFSLSGGAVR